jgi:hypothetical protein
MSRGHVLGSDWAHRDARDDYHNIDDGKFLSTLQQLPSSIRQLLQDSDMRVELREIDGKYRIVKIVKKREQAYLQGTTSFFVYDKDGKRIPLSEEEFNHLLGMEGNPDDVFNRQDVDLQTLDSEHIAPLDCWDVIYDATEFAVSAERMVDNEKWQTLPNTQKKAQLDQLADALIYSADYFPYPADKNLHSPRAKSIAKNIREGMTKQQLGALLGSREVDKRPEIIQDLRRKAQLISAGPEKAKILVRARTMMEQLVQQRKNYKGPIKDPICDSDRSKLWAMWRDQQIKNTGSVPLMPWQFEKAYRFKLQRRVLAGEITKQEAEQFLAERMEKLFAKKGNPALGDEVIRANTEPSLPPWLQAPPPLQEVEDDYEFAPVDWLEGKDEHLEFMDEQETQVFETEVLYE